MAPGKRPPATPDVPAVQPKAPRSSKQKTGKRANWKRYGITIGVNVTLLCLTVLIGAGMFSGLQKMELVNLGRRCSKRSDDLKNEIEAVCTDSPTSNQCTPSWQKSKFDELANCYGRPTGPPKPPNTMARALVYCFSLYTTIGYGAVEAQSTAGKIFAIVYALIGIPLFLGFLNHMGKWYHYCLILTYEELRRRTGAGKHFELTVADPEDVGVFIFALFILFVYLVLAAVIYATVHQWDFWQSFYFAYQSMALLGFGDIYLELEDASFVAIHLLITTIGITLLAMCFFILRDYWSRTVEAISNAIAEKLNLLPPAPSSGANAVGEDDDTLGRESVTFSMKLDDETGGEKAAGQKVLGKGKAKEKPKKVAKAKK